MFDRKVVMISSTALDLPVHREQVRLACERAGFAPHEMMEHGTANRLSPAAVSLRMVEQADIYIAVLAFRYGTIPPGETISLTEMEYNQAVALDKPRLVFIADKEHPVEFKDVETGPGAEKLEALKRRIGEAQVAAYFKSPGELRASVVEALAELALELRTQDLGGDAAAASLSARMHRSSPIPASPEPYIAHPYTFLHTPDLVGRSEELELLSDWVASPRTLHYGASILALVAIGGMGKSVLTWKWFRDIAPSKLAPLAGRMWWSFYDSDGTFENFVTRALCYVSGARESEIQKLSWVDREAMLIRGLNEKPFLIVLDGLERILVAYNRMDAATLSDDELDQQTANFVAGVEGLPAEAAQTFTGQHLLRRTTDWHAGRFLQMLAAVTRSRILITTRLYPIDLQLSTLRTRPGCAAVFLGGLRDADALELWRKLGVSGGERELLPIFNSVKNHPLLIQSLASEIANDRRSPGDFDQWRKDHPSFDPTALPLIQSRTHILKFALSGMSRKAQALLRTIVGFRMPAKYASLQSLLVGEGKLFKSDAGLDRRLTELEDRGLLGWDREPNRYDAHPIVRGVVSQLTNETDQRAVYSELAAHFESIGSPTPERIKSIDDLTATIERFDKLVVLGRFSDAVDLYLYSLSELACGRLAAHQHVIQWLSPLLLDDAKEVEKVVPKAKVQLLNDLAISLDLTGQPSRSMAVYRQAVELSRHSGDKANLCRELGNFGAALCDTGALREAALSLREALQLSRDVNSRELNSICLTNIGSLFALVGQYHLAEKALGHSTPLGLLGGYAEGTRGAALASLALRRNDAKGCLLLADRTLALTAINRHQSTEIRARVLRGRAQLSLGELNLADESLTVALRQASQLKLVQQELPAIIATAELEFARGDLAGAKARLGNVIMFADAGRYPLRQADAYNKLAQIEAALGNSGAAKDAADAAYRHSWCDGPPYAYDWGLKNARTQLDALGVKYPAIAPFKGGDPIALFGIDLDPIEGRSSATASSWDRLE